ncbi:MAG TPA: hypothetical protein VJJ98_00965 [Sedimentisphaerales bacterium]|nr:hypothetical protein [Sedimentisphaerales bacterium]
MVDSVDQDVEGGAEASGDDHFDKAGFVSYAKQRHQALERAAEDKVSVTD